MEKKLLTRPIPVSGETLPAIGIGTWPAFDVGPGKAERGPLEEVLRDFTGLGGSLVDSSPMYGRAEETLGDLAAFDRNDPGPRLRPKLFMATKVWTEGRSQGILQMEDSLRKLRADSIDLMQVHNLVDVGTHLGTLGDWKLQGRIRYLGVTHYKSSAHGDVAKVLAAHPVDFLQINYSVGEREAERTLLPLAREKGVAVIVNRPFGGGGIIRKLQGRALPDWASEIECTTWSQLLLKFVISHPAVTCAIPATSKLANLRDNMAAGLGRLPDEELRQRIARAAA